MTLYEFVVPLAALTVGVVGTLLIRRESRRIEARLARRAHRK